jgi:hypothetical protein
MIAVPRIPPVSDGQRLNFGLVNHIIKRTEYAAELLRKYKCVAGDDMFVEPHYDGTRVSYLQAVGGGVKPQPIETGKMFIGIAASTGALRSVQTINNFVVKNTLAVLDPPLGGATNLGGGFYRLTNNGVGETGAVYKTTAINSSTFSASFNYEIGGQSEADGIVLIFSPTKFLAGAGGGLGYEGGSASSVAIEMDIFQNFFDPNNSHIAIISSGNVSTHLAITNRTIRPSGTLACNYSNGVLFVIHNGSQILSLPIAMPKT